MEQQRLFLILLLGFISFMLYQNWQTDHAPKPVAPITQSDKGGLPGSSEQLPPSSDAEMPVPTGQSQSVQAQAVPQVQAVPRMSADGKIITVETDVYKIRINTQGGDIEEVDLLKYPVSIEQPGVPFQMMARSGPRHFTAQNGFHVTGKTAVDNTPSRQSVYQTAKNDYRLSEGDKNLDVVLSWKNTAGVEFIIRYRFTANSYDIDVTHEIVNKSNQPWTGHSYVRLERTPPAKAGGLAMMPTYTGAVYYSPDKKYDKVDFGEIDDSRNNNQGFFDAINREFAGGWIAFIEHYFVAAFIPPKDDVYRYFTHKPSASGNRYWIGLMSVEKKVAPNETASTQLQLYAGPKIQAKLEKIAPGLELTVDYGWLTILSKPIFWLMKQIHNFVGNWGWSIILLTLSIKLAFYKLSETSYKSMARMKKLGPRMKQISERYADDRQRKGQAMMELYKKEKINPLGGCLPILVQIPVFIALYYVLLESVELRQAPWILWINDLSIKDPYFVLPIIMGASMLFQQKLNPTPMDPMQAKMMMFLPIVFTVMFLFFPSGLVLYWVVNNLLSIAQQWYITKIVIAEKKPT